MKITKLIRTSKYIKITECSEAFKETLYRNRFEVQLSVDKTDVHHQDVGTEFIEQVEEFCEQHNAERWSYSMESQWLDGDNCLLTDDEEYLAAGISVRSIIYFEATPDANRFHNTFLVMFKLSN